MAFETRIAIGLDTTGLRAGVQSVRGALDQLSLQGNRAVGLIDGAFDRLRRTLFSLQGALAGVGLGFGVRELIQTADTMRLLEGRIKLVTDNVKELRQAQTTLFDITQRTRQAYESTVQLYSRVSRGIGDLAKSQEQLFRFTETTNKAILVSGATTQEAAAGVIQFSQALSSGVAAGDEFRSIVENLPRLAEAIADGFNELGFAARKNGETFVGFLRRMRDEGKLTSDRIFPALLSQSDKLDQEFQQLPVIVSQAFTIFRNEISRTISEVDAITGASESLANSIIDIAETVSSQDFKDGLSAMVDSVGDVVGFVRANERELLILATVFAGFRLSRGLPSALRIGGAAGALFGAFAGEGDLVESDEDRLKRLQNERADVITRAGGLATGQIKPRELTAVDRAIDEVTRFFGVEPQAAPTVESEFDKAIARYKELNLEIATLRAEMGEFAGGETLRLAKSFEKTAEAIDLSTNSGFRARENLEKIFEVNTRLAAQQDKEREAAFARSDAIIKEAAEAKRSIELEADAAKKRLDIAGLDERSRLIELRLLDEIQDARARGLPLLKEEIEERKKLIGQIVDADLAEEAAEESRRLTESLFENAAENIQRSFSDAFYEIFRNGKVSFEDLAGSIKNIFARMLAEMAALALVRPVLVQLGFAQGGGGFGFGGGGTASGGAGGGGGFNLGGNSGIVDSLANSQTAASIRQFFGFGTSAFTTTTVGSASGGLALAEGVAAVPGGVGNAAVAGSTTATGAGGLAGGTGALGGLSAGAGIGIGIAAGSFIGGGIAGDSPARNRNSQIGATLGATVGAIFGPVGSIIGGVLGGVAGGLIGPPASNFTAGGNVSFTDEGVRFEPFEDKANAETRQIRDAFANGLTEGAQLLLAASGGRSGIRNIQFQTGTRDEARLDIDGTIDFFEKGIQGAEDALEFAIIKFARSLEDIPPQIELAIKRSLILQGNQVTAQRTAGDIELVKSFLPELSNVFTKLEDTAEGMRKAGIRAEQLGVSLDKVNAGLERQREAVLQQTIGGVVNLRDNLTLLPGAPVTPLDRFNEVQRQFNEAVEGALAGDADDLAKLPNVAQAYVNTARELFATGPKFIAAFEEVTAALDSVIAKAEEALADTVLTEADLKPLPKPTGPKTITPPEPRPFDELVRIAATNLLDLTEQERAILRSAGFGGAASEGGRAHGGPIFGAAGTDTILTPLTSGEFVINREAAANIGMAELHRLNTGRGGDRVSDSVDRFAQINARMTQTMISELRALREEVQKQTHNLDRLATRLERRA